MYFFRPTAFAKRGNSRTRRASRVIGLVPEALERRLLLSGAVSFAPPVSTPVGHDPGPVVADFNSDGKPDLVVTDSTGSTFQIMLGNGSGRFANPVVYEAGDQPNFITAADFNGDGKLDVAYLHWFGNTIDLRLGDGRGGFGPAKTFDAGGQSPFSPVTADFNRDGKLDMATAGWWGGGVRVLLGDGAGNLGPARYMAAGSNTQVLLKGDVNTDGNVDLVVANWGEETVGVFLGDGAGNFVHIDYPAGGPPITIALGDFNKDGLFDLAVGHGVLGMREGDVSILTGYGGGGFNAPVPLGGPELKGFTAADFNGDGTTDLAVRTPDDPDTIFVRLGDGAGGFAAPVEVNAGTSDLVYTYDFNGDGKPDLGSFGPDGESVVVLLNTTGESLVYEAEEAAVTGGALAADHAGFTGFGFVDYVNRSNDAVEFDLDAYSAGPYELTFRYANGSSAARTMGLSVNGAAVPVGVSFARTGSWDAWNTATVTLPLAAGSNKVRLFATGQSGPNLDSLAVRAAPASPPQTYQAESAVLSGPLVASNAPGFTGPGFADYQHGSGDFAEFTVDVPAAGTYALDFRYANGSPTDRALDLAVDGRALAGGVSFAPTGAWGTWNNSSRPVTLGAGRHTVRLTAAGFNGPNLDALTVRVVPPALTLQAEAASLSGPIIASNVENYTGNGFADYQHGSGDWVEFSYDAPVAGTYVFDFGYANGSTSDRPLELKVNGAVVVPRLSFAPTGKWSTWGTATATAALQAGPTRIRLTSVGKNGPNLDALTVRPATPSVQTQFNPAADFSGTQYPNGVWSYGFSDVLAGPLTLYSGVDQVDGAINWHESRVGRPGDLAMHPGMNGDRRG